MILKLQKICLAIYHFQKKNISLDRANEDKGRINKYGAKFVNNNTTRFIFELFSVFKVYIIITKNFQHINIVCLIFN
jgi:hypothetical protein